MPPVVSVMLGAFAAFIGWTLVRALCDGTIYSDGIPYCVGEQPRMFASTVHRRPLIRMAVAPSDGAAATSQLPPESDAEPSITCDPSKVP